MIKAILTFAFLIISLESLFAREVRYLMRSPRGLLMGDAYTTLAEDNYTLFYNPALMGRHDGVSFSLLNFGLGVTNVLDDTDRFEDFPENDAVAITERVMGIPLYLQLGGSPGLKMGGFALNVLANVSTSLSLSNAIHPILDIDYRYDRGFIAGYGLSFGRGKKTDFKQKDKSGSYGLGSITSIGVSVKHINREGLKNDFPVFGTTLLEEINDENNKDFWDIRESLGYSKGKAWGFDAGFDHITNLNSTQIGFGASILNIGGIDFVRYEGSEKVPDQDMHINLGSHFRQDFGILGYAFSFDLHPINYDMDFARMAHVGFLLDLPIVDFLAGYNGGYYSVGAEVDLWMFKFGAGLYKVELGREYKELPGKRAIIYLKLLEFSIGG